MTNAVTLASLANSGYLRNRIINGNMVINQRNASSNTSTGGSVIYMLDRWYVGSNGASVTVQRVTGATANQYRLQVTGAAGVTNATVSQRIESSNCADMAGQTVTLSFDAANSLLNSLTWSVSYANTTDTFGTLTSPTVTGITSGLITISSTIARYSVTFDVPSAANTGLVVQFTVGAQTSGTFTLGNIQLELGTQATPFEWRPYGTELALCQRYFETGNEPELYLGGASLNAVYISVPFKVTKRATPTIALANWQIWIGGTASSTTPSVAFNFATQFAALVTGSGLSGYYSPNGTWTASAEL